MLRKHSKPQTLHWPHLSQRKCKPFLYVCHLLLLSSTRSASAQAASLLVQEHTTQTTTQAYVPSDAPLSTLPPASDMVHFLNSLSLCSNTTFQMRPSLTALSGTVGPHPPPGIPYPSLLLFYVSPSYTTPATTHPGLLIS